MNIEHVDIVELHPDDWQEYRDLRLHALKFEPNVFARTYEEELATEEIEWRKKIVEAQKAERYWLLFVKKEDCLVGMVSARINEGVKYSHKATIADVYVKKEFRRMGVAKKLLTEMLRRLMEVPQVIKIQLRVSAQQEGAIFLYESLGFSKVARLEKEMCVNGVLQDTYEMSMFVK